MQAQEDLEKSSQVNHELSTDLAAMAKELKLSRQAHRDLQGKYDESERLTHLQRELLESERARFKAEIDELKRNSEL